MNERRSQKIERDWDTPVSHRHKKMGGTATEMSDAHRLLNESPQEFEEGWKRLPSGIGYVAARTEMRDCSGQMAQNWFEDLRTTEQYKSWFPEEHVYFRTNRPTETRSIIEDTQIIHERLGTDAVLKLKLKFRDPSDLRDTDRFSELGITAEVLACGGPQHLLSVVRFFGTKGRVN